MLKMFHYMKERWYYVVMIIVLLFVQAYCDLSLPDYTSKIVNVGIQQKGIEDGVPDTIRKESMEHLLLFLDEKEKAKEDMQKMLDYVDKLDELDTSSVEPMSHIFEDENVFREDVVTNGDNHEAMLANAPKQKEDQYQVPKTIG